MDNLSDNFTLKQLFDWYNDTKPELIYMNKAQFEHYYSLLEDQEKVLRFKGVDVRISQ